ncbi:class I SAM-dependent methyltransferase [Fulvivirgaceae bacterium BMA10]|uniref:Class I SAM-dependent methyltransferase n=1 Tax=Splendidivirga corallicola TaxID=3051826 RepID=A0ABT8KY01_9BACT|nr:class I SAM-dependent methyltransferase [Fulvivirgaceae bacterium BMA10]
MATSEIESRTSKQYWEDYWDDEQSAQMLGPIVRNPKDKQSEALYLPFDKFLSKMNFNSILEIGGAPGRFTAYFGNRYNSKIGILDFSDIGLQEAQHFLQIHTKNRFELYKKDLFKDSLDDVPLYDIVYSLGFVEHFENLRLSVEKHLALAKPKGLVIIGVPVLLGINKWLASNLAPQNLATHYTMIMDRRNWAFIEEIPNVEIVFNKYVGGFLPQMHHRLENPIFVNKVIYKLLHGVFRRIYKFMPYKDKVNSKYWSYYYYVVIKKLK